MNIMARFLLGTKLNTTYGIRKHTILGCCSGLLVFAFCCFHFMHLNFWNWMIYVIELWEYFATSHWKDRQLNARGMGYPVFSNSLGNFVMLHPLIHQNTWSVFVRFEFEGFYDSILLQFLLINHSNTDFTFKLTMITTQIYISVSEINSS